MPLAFSTSAKIKFWRDWLAEFENTTSTADIPTLQTFVKSKGVIPRRAACSSAFVHTPAILGDTSPIAQNKRGRKWSDLRPGLI